MYVVARGLLAPTHCFTSSLLNCFQACLVEMTSCNDAHGATLTGTFDNSSREATDGVAKNRERVAPRLTDRRSHALLALCD